MSPTGEKPTSGTDRPHGLGKSHSAGITRQWVATRLNRRERLRALSIWLTPTDRYGGGLAVNRFTTASISEAIGPPGHREPSPVEDRDSDGGCRLPEECRDAPAEDLGQVNVAKVRR
jgi:hypothetical protein